MTSDQETVTRALAKARFASVDDQDAFDEVDLAFGRILRNRPDADLRDLLTRWAGGSEPAGAGSLLERDTLEALGESRTAAPVGLVLVLTTRPERAGMPNEAKAMMQIPRPLAEDMKSLPTAVQQMAGPKLVDAMVQLLREDTCPSCGGSFGGFGYMPDEGRRDNCPEPRHR